jgi:hypothetical protein
MKPQTEEQSRFRIEKLEDRVAPIAILKLDAVMHHQTELPRPVPTPVSVSLSSFYVR